MTKEFYKFLLISLIVHIVLIALWSFTFTKDRNLTFKKDKDLKIILSNTNNASIKKLKQSFQKSSQKKNIHYGYKNYIEGIKISEQIKNEVSQKEYIIDNLNFIPDSITNINKSLFSDENLRETVKDDLKTLDMTPINFGDGSNRVLTNSYSNLLKEINLASNINVKILIHIDSSGFVIYAEIIESSGEIDKDNSILDIVKKWKFEENEKERQLAVVNLNYLIR